MNEHDVQQLGVEHISECGYYIQCSHTGAEDCLEYTPMRPTPEQAVQDAEKGKWVKVGIKWICPACRAASVVRR